MIMSRDHEIYMAIVYGAHLSSADFLVIKVGARSMPLGQVRKSDQFIHTSDVQLEQDEEKHQELYWYT